MHFIHSTFHFFTYTDMSLIPRRARRSNRKKGNVLYNCVMFCEKEERFSWGHYCHCARRLRGHRVDRQSDESRARTEWSGGGGALRAGVGGAKPFTRRRGRLLTDTQTGRQASEERAESVLKSVLAVGREFPPAIWDVFSAAFFVCFCTTPGTIRDCFPSLSVLRVNGLLTGSDVSPGPWEKRSPWNSHGKLKW